MVNKVVKNILEHPDKQEIISKMLLQIPVRDIAEHLKVKYSEITDPAIVLSEATLKKFEKEYLDIYAHLKADLELVKTNEIQQDQELRKEIQGSSNYHTRLNEMLEREVEKQDKEINIRHIIEKMVANIEHRAAQVFEQIQEDPASARIDRTAIDWMNTLLQVVEKYDKLLHGDTNKINVQNNINIQMADTHINTVFNIIREILSKLDYDTSLMFVDMFNEEMNKLKAPAEKALSVEKRLEKAEQLEVKIENKLSE